MFCPYCSTAETKVIDSRLVAGGMQVKRRRECTNPACRERFTTFEAAELTMPKVIKRDGRREPFDEDKLRRGLQKACEKRPIQVDAFDLMMQKIEHHLRSQGEREISASHIGDVAMEALREVDQVAFVRFASVYRSFEDIEAFQKEIQNLASTQDNHHDI